MQVREILRVKGSRLVSIAPSGLVIEAAKRMARENLGSLVVMDHDRLTGMFTFHELLQVLAQSDGNLGTQRVADSMDRNPVMADPEMDVNELRRIMLESGARYLPVVKNDKLLGVVSFRDVAKAVTPAVVNIRTESRQRTKDLSEFFGGGGGAKTSGCSACRRVLRK